MKVNRFYFYKELTCNYYGVILITSVSLNYVKGNWFNFTRNNGYIERIERQRGSINKFNLDRQITKLEIEYYGLIDLFELTEDEIKLYIKD